jgi:MFS superfamily sulfate permease-like transporter
VLVGFVSGASLVIAINQLGPLLGLTVTASAFPVQDLVWVLAHLGSTLPAAAAIGLVGAVIVYAMREVKVRFASKCAGDSRAVARRRVALGLFLSLSALIVVIIAIVVATALYRDHGNTLKTLPMGCTVLSGLTAPTLPGFALLSVIVTALVIRSWA